MSKMVRFLVIFLIAILIGTPLIAGGHKYIAYPVIFVHGFNADMGLWQCHLQCGYEGGPIFKNNCWIAAI